MVSDVHEVNERADPKKKSRSFPTRLNRAIEFPYWQVSTLSNSRSNKPTNAKKSAADK